MQSNKELLSSLRQKYKVYRQKVNLTEEAKVRTNQILAELALIALVDSTANHKSREAISMKLAQVEKVLDARLKGQSWLSFLSKSNEVVSLDEVWRELLLMEDDARRNLIDEVCRLKKISS